MDYSFWRNRKVFLTGHTGFKGAWLTMWLRRMGAEVTGYSLPAPTDPSLFKLADVAAGIRSIEGDVRDLEHLKKSLIEAQPEVVLHLAAQALVRASYADPIQTFSSNIMGTVNMLEAGRACPSLRSMIIVTSDKCYENREWHWGYRENEAMGGRDPYSSSKGCAELVTAAFYSSFYQQTGNIGLASARAGNVIGGGDFARRSGAARGGARRRGGTLGGGAHRRQISFGTTALGAGNFGEQRPVRRSFWHGVGSD